MNQESLPDAFRYVEENSRSLVEWGVSDCTAWSAGWVRHATGYSLKLPPYSTRDEANELIAKAGTLADLWSNVIDEDEDCDLREGYGEPDIGDVGIINTHMFGHVGGIFLNHRNFAWRGDRDGYRLLRPRLHTIVKYWRVPT